MRRRDFLAATAAAAPGLFIPSALGADQKPSKTAPPGKGPKKAKKSGPGYASPREAMQAEREKLLYTVAIHVGTEVEKPDYLATIDADPTSPTYSQVIHRL